MTKYTLILPIILIVACNDSSGVQNLLDSDKIFVIQPQTKNTADKKSLIMFLMGHGGNHVDTAETYQNIANELNCVWVILRGDSVIGKDAYTWKNTTVEYDRISTTIDRFGKQYNISSSRIVLYGFNHEIAYKYGLKHSNKFAGIITFSARGINSLEKQKIENKNLKVSAIIASDNIVMKGEHNNLTNYLMEQSIEFQLDTNYRHDKPCCYPVNASSMIVKNIKWIIE
jgi:predicted esterase